MSRTVVRCLGLIKRFGGVRAVDGLDLSVEQGQVLVLLGPSGSGKTTTLRLIAGFDAADSGTIEVGGRLASGPGTHIAPEHRRVGVVFQDYALFPHLTVAENVAYGLPTLRDRGARVAEVLSLVGLSGLERRMPHELSGGQQQRVALARALAPRPQLLLMDEPFSNLHPEMRAQMREEVREILKRGQMTAVFVTHDQEEALFMGDLVAVINQGRLEQVDTPERIFHSPLTTFVARFMGIADFLPARLADGCVLTELGRAEAAEAEASVALAEGLEVMARPDDLTLAPSETSNGTITARIFKGAFNLYKVTLASGRVVHCLQAHTRHYPVGTRVEVRLDPGHPLLCFVGGRVLAGMARPGDLVTQYSPMPGHASPYDTGAKT